MSIRKLILNEIMLISLMSPFSYGTVINIPGDYPAIQQGIDASANGDTVLVADGHYYERVDFNGKGILLTSQLMVDGDTLHIRNTLIDADTLVLGFADTGSVVCFISGEDSTAVLQGFTLLNGIGTQLSTHYRSGGGICCYNASPVILNNIIKENSTNDGGGISCDGQSEPLIYRNCIVNNVAKLYGGGIICTDSNPEIRENKIIGNSVTGWMQPGGGIFIYNSTALIIDNIISNNTAYYSDGGGILISDGPACSVINNMISGNIAANGGGLVCAGSEHVISGNLIKENEASFAAGILCACEGTLSHNIIVGNTAENAGGVSFQAPFPDFINNTVCGNSSGIYKEYGEGYLTLINCIIRENGEYELDGETDHINLTYCDIQGGWSGQGNIDCDPQFCAPVYDDYHLQASSCCLGAGQDGADIGALGPGCYFPCGDYVIGDFNGSGQFNVADIITSYSKLATGDPEPGMTCECPPGSGNSWAVAMDVNGSCAFNVADIVMAYQRLALGQPELFPCPQCPPNGGR